MGASLRASRARGRWSVVANHLYGVADVLIMGRILTNDAARYFRVWRITIFSAGRRLERVILPISFDENEGSRGARTSRRVQRRLRYLGQGGPIGIFPGGRIDRRKKPFAQPMGPGLAHLSPPR